jgi:hypothetical protein
MKSYPVFLVNNLFVAAHNKNHAADVAAEHLKIPVSVDLVLDTSFTYFDAGMLMLGKVFPDIKGIPLGKL